MPLGLGIGVGLHHWRPTGATWLPSSLFENDEDGAWYDPSDLTSMYVGRNGSGGNPGVGDVVGVILDKSQMGGKTAANFIAGQSDLFDDTDDLSTSWTYTYSGGTLTYTGDGSGFIGPAKTLLESGTLNKWYIVSFDVDSVTGDSIRLYVGPGAYPYAPAYLNATGIGVGSHTYLVQAADSNLGVAFSNTNAGSETFVVSNISVVELPGNHAVAPSDAARPVLRDEIVDGINVDVSGQPELVTNGDFATGDLTGWTLPNPFGSPTDWSVAGGEAVLDGTQTNFVYLRTASNIGATAGKWYLLEFDITARTAGSVSLQNAGAVDSGHSSTAYTTTGTKLELFRSGGDGYVEIVADANFNGSIDNVSVKEVPASAARYYYLDSDGTDDELEVSYTASGPTTAAYAVTLAAESTVDVYEFATPASRTDAGMFSRTSSTTELTFEVTGAAFAGQAAITHAAGIDTPHVYVDQAATNNFETWKDGVSSGTDTSGTWPASNTTQLSLFCNTTPALHIEMNMYGFVFIDRVLTDAERELVEAYLASKSGVTLA